MKKLLVVAVCGVLALASCNQDKKTAFNPAQIQNDSLRAIIDARDNEINDMMGTLNDIQQGFADINEAENRVTIAKDSESKDKNEQVKENVQFIAQRMKENRELIKKLQQQLRETGFKGDAMKKTLQNESNQKTETINTQDKQLNTGWYVFGTKSELKGQRILDGDRVLQGAFNKSYFTKIDIRITKEIKLYSKSARLLTAHPSSSYSLSADTNGQYVLRITDPQTFWSTSKYLVIQVK